MKTKDPLAISGRTGPCSRLLCGVWQHMILGGTKGEPWSLFVTYTLMSRSCGEFMNALRENELHQAPGFKMPTLSSFAWMDEGPHFAITLHF